jgi:hypothetical protein
MASLSDARREDADVFSFFDVFSFLFFRNFHAVIKPVPSTNSKLCNAGLLIPRVSLLEPLELICEETAVSKSGREKGKEEEKRRAYPKSCS